jgi:hypothetical protein
VFHRLRLICEENALLILLIASFLAVLLVLTPSLVIADSWFSLIAGREIVEFGLPHSNAITVLGQGREWIDQQWLAHLAYYGAEVLGGLRVVTLANILLIATGYSLAVAAARHRGASQRSTLIFALLVILASPWAWQVRAQTLALPLFTGLLWLLVDHQQRRSARVLFALPILIVWANVHGTAVMAVILAMAAGAIDLIMRRGNPRVAIALIGAAPLCLLVSPYALDLPGYYHLMLVDPPFQGLIVEWRPTRPEPKTVLFFTLAVATAVLAVWQRRRLTLFEAFALAFTFWVGLDAIRGVTWFVLTVLVIVPYLLDGALRMRDEKPHRGANLVISGICLGALVIGFALTAAQPTSWFESVWPTAALPAIAQATEDPASTVYAISSYSDWLYWHQPDLRGRLAYDIRFEIYRRATIQATADFVSMRGPDWAKQADPFDVVVLNKPRDAAMTRALVRGGRVVAFSGPDITVLTRPPETP